MSKASSFFSPSTVGSAPDFRMAKMSTTPADSLAFGPRKSTNYQATKLRENEPHPAASLAASGQLGDDVCVHRVLGSILVGPQRRRPSTSRTNRMACTWRSSSKHSCVVWLGNTTVSRDFRLIAYLRRVVL